MTHHEVMTRTIVYTQRTTSYENHDATLNLIERIRETELGGRGIVYRRVLHGSVYDSLSKTYSDGGFQLILMQIL
jgi:hypothetical protein